MCLHLLAGIVRGFLPVIIASIAIIPILVMIAILVMIIRAIRAIRDTLAVRVTRAGRARLTHESYCGQLRFLAES